jgi:hypothetical protein
MTPDRRPVPGAETEWQHLWGSEAQPARSSRMPIEGFGRYGTSNGAGALYVPSTNHLLIRVLRSGYLRLDQPDCHSVRSHHAESSPNRRESSRSQSVKLQLEPCACARRAVAGVRQLSLHDALTDQVFAAGAVQYAGCAFDAKFERLHLREWREQSDAQCDHGAQLYRARFDVGLTL